MLTDPRATCLCVDVLLEIGIVGYGLASHQVEKTISDFIRYIILMQTLTSKINYSTKIF